MSSSAPVAAMSGASEGEVFTSAAPPAKKNLYIIYYSMCASPRPSCVVRLLLGRSAQRSHSSSWWLAHTMTPRGRILGVLHSPPLRRACRRRDRWLQMPSRIRNSGSTDASHRLGKREMGCASRASVGRRGRPNSEEPLRDPGMPSLLPSASISAAWPAAPAGTATFKPWRGRCGWWNPNGNQQTIRALLRAHRPSPRSTLVHRMILFSRLNGRCSYRALLSCR